MLRRVGFGFLAWLVPYLTAIPLMPLMESDEILFKTIMVVVGSLVGALLTVIYFAGVRRSYLREGVLLGLVWLLLSWGLDFVALLPFSQVTLGRYFLEIGLRYVGMLSPTVAVGYVLRRRLEA
jgi:hypothetical protein